MHALDTLVALLLDHLAWASLQALVLAAAVALVICLRPNLAPSVRCALWWLVGLSVVVGLGWRAPIAVSLPVATPMTTAASANVPRVHAGAAATAPAVRAASAAAAVPAADAAAQRAVNWRAWTAGLWLLGVLVQIAWLTLQHRRLRALWRSAVSDAALQVQCDAAAREVGLRHPPTLRVSDAVRSPLVSGAWRPVLLWPGRADLAPCEASLALAHELAHLRRRDLWLAWIPALAQRLFFFHPAVWWAAREYALEREAACDDCVVRQRGAAPGDYAGLLLRLGVMSTRCAGLASASPTFRALRHRLTSLQGARTLRGRAAWVMVGVIAAAGVMPYRLVVARVAVPATPAVAAGVAPTSAASAAGWPVAVPPLPPAPPAPLMPPVPPVPPVPPAPEAPGLVGFAPHNVSLSITPDTPNGMALFDHDSVMIAGTRADEVAAKRLHRRGVPMLYVRRGDKAYVIHDVATIRRTEQIYAPVTKLVQRQSEIATQQGGIVSQQGKFIAQEYQLATLQSQLAMKRAQLQVAALNRDIRDASYATTAGSQPPTAPVQSDAEMRSLQAQQADLTQRQAALEKRIGAQRKALAQEQRDLGVQQQALGTQQRELTASVQRQMDALVTQAITDGVAKPVRR